MSNIIRSIKLIIGRWKADQAARESAAVSFYTLLALPSLLLSIVAFSSLFFDSTVVREEFLRKATNLLGTSETDLLIKIITAIPPAERYGLPVFLGVILLLFSAGGLFSSLKSGLNRIWNVTPKSYAGVTQVKRQIIQRLLLFLLALILGFLFLIAMSVDLIMVAGTPLLETLLPASLHLVQYMSVGVSFFLLVGVLIAMYRLLPDAKIAWKDVFVGAILTALLLSIGKLGVGLYISEAHVGSAYGAAGSVVVLLVSIYYSALIFFFGAECTQVYATKYGSSIKPNKHAEYASSWLTRVKRYIQIKR